MNQHYLHRSSEFSLVVYTVQHNKKFCHRQKQAIRKTEVPSEGLDSLGRGYDHLCRDPYIILIILMKCYDEAE